MYESRRHRPIAPSHFLKRVAVHTLVAAGVVVASVGLGMAGYCYFEQLEWRDAFLNTAMLLGGMGPVDMPQTSGGKLFAGIFALYAGLVFLVVIAIVLAPIVHRVLHTFHWEGE